MSRDSRVEKPGTRPEWSLSCVRNLKSRQVVIFEHNSLNTCAQGGDEKL